MILKSPGIASAPAAGGGGSDITVITSPNDGSGGIRSDGPYNTGFQFIANSNMTVTKMGRTKVTGNTGLWPIWLFETTQTLPIAMAMVDLTSGVVGTTYYADLAAPVSLTAGLNYVLAVDGGGHGGRAIGGDPNGQNWHEIGNIGTTSDITIVGSCYSIQDYLRNDTTQPRLGFNLQVTPATMTVTQLGRFNSYPGASGTHTLRITDSAGNTIDSVSITNDGTIGFKYASFGTPVVLLNGGVYYVFSEESSGGDPVLWDNGWGNYIHSSGILQSAYGAGEGSAFLLGGGNNALGIVDVVYNSGTHLFQYCNGYVTAGNGKGYNDADFMYHL